MPKVIADLRETLLQTARQMLLEEGYGALTMRDMAERCGIAVGTLYNYFPSKESLAAHVMLSDWQQALEAMKADAQAAESPLEAVRGVHAGIVQFRQLYAPAWQAYADAGSAAGPQLSYHGVLIGQLQEIILPVLEEWGCLYTSALPVCLAEMLLTAAGRAAQNFDDIAPILARMLTP